MFHSRLRFIRPSRNFGAYYSVRNLDETHFSGFGRHFHRAVEASWPRGAPQLPDQSDCLTHACGLVGSKASSAEQKPQGARRISTLQGAAEPVGGETTLVSTLRLIKFR